MPVEARALVGFALAQGLGHVSLCQLGFEGQLSSRTRLFFETVSWLSCSLHFGKEQFDTLGDIDLTLGALQGYRASAQRTQGEPWLQLRSSFDSEVFGGI